MELEESRRTALAAEMALVLLQRERVAAWIALYRALGGGWVRPDPALADAGASRLRLRQVPELDGSHDENQ